MHSGKLGSLEQAKMLVLPRDFADLFICPLYLQFFILYKSAHHLDFKHTVFGRVVGGVESLSSLAKSHATFPPFQSLCSLLQFFWVTEHLLSPSIALCRMSHISDTL
jgi:hypothetical protein